MRAKNAPRSKIAILFAAVFFAVAPLTVGAAPLALTLGGGVDQCGFPDDQKAQTGVFKPENAYTITGIFEGDFFSFLDFSLGYTFDPIQKHIIKSTLTFTLGHLHAGLGAFFGFTPYNFANTNAGFSLRAGFELPYFFFAEANFFSSMGTENAVQGDTRNGYSFEGGFWIGSMMLIGFVDYKAYINRDANDIWPKTTLNKMGGKMRFFWKNIGFRFDLFGGIKTLTRQYIDTGDLIHASSAPLDSFAAPYGGLRVEIDFDETCTLFIDGEAAPIGGALAATIAAGFKFTLST